MQRTPRACSPVSFRGQGELRKRRDIEKFVSVDEIELQKESTKTSYSEQILSFVDSLAEGIYRYSKFDTLVGLGFLVIALLTRLYRIGDGNHVIWDEAHFGKFASSYIRRSFYTDLHPPLGKMIVALGGILAGYRGDFNFDSGATYPENLNYSFMRAWLSLFGVIIVPLAYFTALEFKLSKKAAFIAALAVLCDNAYLTISRYILLDSMLICFTVSTLFCMSCFRNHSHEPFNGAWWFWLAATGINIGCVTSIKWVGFLVTALVGWNTIEDLLFLITSRQTSKVQFSFHFLARVLCLIILPIFVYFASFAANFAILKYSGSGDAQMGSLFQASLAYGRYKDNPMDVAYGSIVTLRNQGYGGGLLHSHSDQYPEGSKQSQVTNYYHFDDNNHWKIMYPHDDHEKHYYDDVRILTNGDMIRLNHIGLKANLHSHKIWAPLTDYDYEVSTYGSENGGDEKDHWIVHVIDDYEKTVTKNTKVRALFTTFQLRHAVLGCQLRMPFHSTLPRWGHKQGEVTCDRYNRTDRTTWFNIEDHQNSKFISVPKTTVEEQEKHNYQSNFIDDVLHLNMVMQNTNNMLTPDDPNSGSCYICSSPVEWPFCSVGLRLNGWVDGHLKVYLMGNPLVWVFGTISLGLFLALCTGYFVQKNVSFDRWNPADWSQFTYVGRILVLGWTLHYIPFLLLPRVTYLHHYFPALYFVILMQAFILDRLTLHVSQRASEIVFLCYGLAVLFMFLYFMPLSYGWTGHPSMYKDRKWLSTWTMA